MLVGVKRFEDLRAWQAARAFKLRVYELLDSGRLSAHPRLETQLREAAASAPSHISEGFGRFDPADFARFVKMARAAVLECRNHLQDAVDRGALDEATQQAVSTQSDEVLTEVGGLLDYLHSPEARRNAERVRHRRAERYRKRQRPIGDTPDQDPER